MPSVSALAMASLCAQRKFNVHPIARHYEPVNLYAAVVAKPSERKSPTISLAAAPIYRYQREENERRRPLVEEYQDRRDMLQRRIESMKKASGGKNATSDPQSMMDDIALLRREPEDLETVVRIAGLLHVCDHVEKAAELLMPGETIQRASKIGEAGPPAETSGGRFSPVRRVSGQTGTPADIGRPQQGPVRLFQKVRRGWLPERPWYMHQITYRKYLARFLRYRKKYADR